MSIPLNTATYVLLFLLLTVQPNPGLFPTEAKLFQAFGLGLGLVLVLGQRKSTGPFSFDLSDCLVVCLGAALTVAAGRTAFLFFTISLVIAKQVILTRPKEIPVWAIVTVLALVASLTMRETQHMGRWALLIGDPNFSAIICLIVLIGVLRSGGGSVMGKLALAAVPIALMVLTVSRMGLLCILLTLFAAASRKIRSSRRLGVAMLTILFLGSIAGPVLATLAIQAGYVFSELQGGDNRYLSFEDSSNLSRVLGYLLAIDRILQGDILLMGDASYADQLPEFVPLPHNWFLGGIVSYGAIVTVVGGLYMYAWRSVLSDGVTMTFLGIYLLAAGMLNVSVLTGLFIVCLGVVLSISRADDPISDRAAEPSAT